MIRSGGRTMKEKTEKRTRFGVANLVWALVSFGIFMAVGLTGHYMAVGEFVTAELAGTYAILALVGAAAVLLRLWRFTLFFYLGCGLGWGAGWFVSGLKGDFAPTAGTICTFFLIGLFALLGIIAQWQAMKKKLARRREEKERARAEAEAERLRLELEEAKKERESAGAALEVAAGEPGPEETKPAAETKEEPAAAGAEEK